MEDSWEAFAIIEKKLTKTEDLIVEKEKNSGLERIKNKKTGKLYCEHECIHDEIENFLKDSFNSKEMEFCPQCSEEKKKKKKEESKINQFMPGKGAGLLILTKGKMINNKLTFKLYYKPGGLLYYRDSESVKYFQIQGDLEEIYTNLIGQLQDNKEKYKFLAKEKFTELGTEEEKTEDIRGFKGGYFFEYLESKNFSTLINEIKKILQKIGGPFFISKQNSKENLLDGISKEPYVGKIFYESNKNENYRQVIYTNLDGPQIVLQCLIPGESIPLEIHPDIDQFFFITHGKAALLYSKSGMKPMICKAGFGIMIPKNTFHQISNAIQNNQDQQQDNDEDEKEKNLHFYTIYSKQEHEPKFIQKRQSSKQ